MKKSVGFAMMAILFLAASFLTLSWGIVPATPGEAALAVWQMVTDSGETGSAVTDVVKYIRLPHFILAFLAGSGLALCGTVMQSVMKNPLADPYLLGISAGAALGAVFAIAAGVGIIEGINGTGLFAFVGAVLVSILILIFSSFVAGNQALILLLIGFAVNALCTATLSFIVAYLSDVNKTKSIQFWLMGNIQTEEWGSIGVLAIVILAGLAFFMSQCRILDLMLVGDELSLSMGRNLAHYRKLYILIIAVIMGTIVYMTGIIGFVGLIIPHMIRLIVGSGHKKLVFFAFLAGGCFLSWSDVLGRNCIPGVSIPIGIAAAVCGAPVFVWMLLRHKYGGGS